MAPIPALPLGFREVPLSDEERSLGLKFHLVRPGVTLEPAKRRRAPIDDAEVDLPKIEAPAERSTRAPMAVPKKVAELDVHRTKITPEVVDKIIRLYTQDEVQIRTIAARFGLQYQSVWRVLAHLVRPKAKARPRPKQLEKRRLGLAFRGSVPLARK